jgi:DNA-binding NarL/FixJ family response regulator
MFQTIKMLWRLRGLDVAVLEPREVLRYGLATMLGRLGGVSSLECHRSMDELLVARSARGNGWNPDIVIVSGACNDDITDLVQSMFPTSRVLELIVSAEPGDLALAAKTHADGYLMLYDITEATLDGTLQALMRGELPMPPPVANYLLERVRSSDTSPSRIQPYFSPRERDVIALLLKGLSNRQIAHRLGISLHSAKRHVSAVLHKVNSPSRAHFVARMLRDD